MITYEEIVEIAKQLKANTLEVKNITPTMLNTVLTGDHAGVSLGLILARTDDGIEVFERSNYLLVTMLQPNTLNAIRENDPDKGDSIALLLSMTEKGHKILNATTCPLKQFIDHHIKTHILSNGNFTQLEAIFDLCDYNSIYNRLLQIEKQLITEQIDVQSISSTLLNAPVKSAVSNDCIAISLAMLLAETDDGLKVLAKNDYYLANLITAETLNYITIQANYNGESVAFFLVKKYHSPFTIPNHKILTANGCRLLNLIDKFCLNYIIKSHKYHGESVALHLSVPLHNLNGFKLLNLISRETLNATITDNKIFNEYSLAFQMSEESYGFKLFMANDYYLTNLIDAKTINLVGSINSCAHGRSITSNLLNRYSCNEMYSIFKHDNYRLAMSMDKDILNNRAISLILNHNGRDLLAYNNFYLLKLIEPKLLCEAFNNISISDPKEILSFLASTEIGREILAFNDYEITRKIDIKIMIECGYYDLMIAGFADETKYPSLFIPSLLTNIANQSIEHYLDNSEENIERIYATLIKESKNTTDQTIQDNIQAKILEIMQIITMSIYNGMKNNFIIQTFTKPIPEVLKLILCTELDITDEDTFKFISILLKQLTIMSTEQNKQQIHDILIHLASIYHDKETFMNELDILLNIFHAKHLDENMIATKGDDKIKSKINNINNTILFSNMHKNKMQNIFNEVKTSKLIN